MSAREITTALKGRSHGRYGMAFGGILKSRNPSRKQSDLPPAIKAFADDGEPVEALGNNRWKVGWDVMNERGEVVGF